MKVKELRELLAEAPDDLKVMVMVEDHSRPGMFAFIEACTCETGISTLGPANDGDGGETVFLVLPHGAGVSEEEMDNGDNAIPELN